ncbi:MAG TPA: RDD family protein [candidate division Zixibacteria bacterium]|nr:RDD family protein [candidate division Zixibacteria bacterium]
MSEKTEKTKDSAKTEKPDVKLALATFKERAIAALVDYGIIFGIYVVGIILQIAIGYVPIVGGWLSWLLGMLIYVAGLAAMFYIFIWMPFKKDGQTIGKKMQNIKIMIVADPEKWTLQPVGEEDLTAMILRGIIGWIEASIVFGLLAWYFITNDKNSQRLADQLGKTVVVQVDPETKVPLKKPRA